MICGLIYLWSMIILILFFHIPIMEPEYFEGFTIFGKVILMLALIPGFVFSILVIPLCLILSFIHKGAPTPKYIISSLKEDFIDRIFKNGKESSK